tara:strand:+ start:10585 stop:11583 length:999 start_codon:yes stop_codon:yes gene_type:complete
MTIIPKKRIKNKATPEEIATTKRNAAIIGNILSFAVPVGYLGNVARIIKQNKSFVKNLRTNIRKTQDSKGLREMDYNDPRIKLKGDVLVRKGKLNVYRGEGTPTIQDAITLSYTKSFIKKGPTPIGRRLNKLSGKQQRIDSYRPQIASDIMAQKIQVSQLGRYATTDPRRGKMYGIMKRRGQLTAGAEPQYDAVRKTYRIKVSDFFKGLNAKSRTIRFVNKSYPKNRADEIKRRRGKLTMSNSWMPSQNPATDTRRFINATKVNESLDVKRMFNVIQKNRTSGRTRAGNPGVYTVAPRNPFTGRQLLEKGYILKNVDKQFLIPKKLDRKLRK